MPPVEFTPSTTTLKFAASMAFLFTNGNSKTSSI